MVHALLLHGRLGIVLVGLWHVLGNKGTDLANPGSVRCLDHVPKQLTLPIN